MADSIQRMQNLCLIKWLVGDVHDLVQDGADVRVASDPFRHRLLLLVPAVWVGIQWCLVVTSKTSAGIVADSKTTCSNQMGIKLKIILSYYEAHSIC